MAEYPKAKEAATEELSGDRLIDAAIKVCGLKSAWILRSQVIDGAAVIDTQGGQRIVWRAGDPPVEIPPHQHPEAKPRAPKKK